MGGTFTDLLLLNVETGEKWQAKVASTPEDQSLGVRSGIDQILAKIPNGASVVVQVTSHGTTVATNGARSLCYFLSIVLRPSLSQLSSKAKEPRLP